MTLLIILLAVFAGVALMVVFGQRFGALMPAQQQQKFAKISQILVFVLLVSALIKMLL